MSTPLSNEFIFSFLSECHVAGLTKEAAAELLQQESINHVANQSPGFAEGFFSVCPSSPMLRAQDFEKSAMTGAAKAPGVIKSLWGAGSAALRNLKGGAKHVTRGAQAIAGPARKIVDPTTGAVTMRQSLARKYPLTALGVGVAGTAAGSYGMHRMLSDGANSDLDIPLLPSGGYSAKGDAEAFANQLETGSKPIYALNQRLNQSNVRRKELEDSIARRDANSASAAVELRTMDRDKARAEATHKQYLDTYAVKGEKTEAKLQSLEARRAALDKSRTSWWSAPRRAWDVVTGQDPKERIDRDMDRVQSEIGRFGTNKKLLDGYQKKMISGSEGLMPLRTSEQMQKDFFPTY